MVLRNRDHFTSTPSTSIMDTSPSLKRLVKRSIFKKTNRKVFVTLLAQLCDSGSISDKELVENLLDLSISHSLPLARARQAESSQLKYVLEYFLSSGVKVARFFSLLEQLSYANQRKYVLSLKGCHATELRQELFQEFIKGFTSYTLSLSSKLGAENSVELKNLWYQAIFLWGSILEADASHFSSPSFKDFCMTVIKASNAVQDPAITAYFLSRVNSIFKSSDSLQEYAKLETSTQIPQLAPKAQSYSLTSKKFTNYNRLKKVMWLNSQFLAWNFGSDLLQRFTLFFGISLKDHDTAILKIARSFFDGMSFVMAADVKAYVRFNWKNYVVSRLPLQLRSISAAALSAESANDFIKAILAYDHPSLTSMFVGGAKHPYDLRKEFLKSCAYKNLISYDQFTSAFAIDKENYSSAVFDQELERLDRVASLSSEFNSKLMNLNTEFTSLKESKFIEFLQRLPSTNFCYSEVQQKKLSALIVNLVQQLIKEKNDEKLGRLSLSLSNCLPIANFIFFNNPKGPWSILEQLVAYIDKQHFNIDEDDGNFSETYETFGIILSSAICISKIFNIDFCNFNIHNSYTVDFINRFFYRSSETFTFSLKSEIEEENTIVSNFDTLFNDWANALFDVTNDGLSDDLIKSVNVKQIYKFIIVIFKQAVMSRVLGSLGESSFNNGIDYLSQNFLVPCSLGVMEWISTQIGPSQKSSEHMVSILIKTLEAMNVSEASSDSNEPNYVSNMILNIVGPGIMKRLAAFQAGQPNEKAAQLLGMLQKIADPEYSEYDPACKKKFGGELAMTKQIRDEVVQLVKSHDAVSNVHQMIKSWVRIHSCWETMPETELYNAILGEEKRWNKHRKYGVEDEVKATLDMQMFMTVSGSLANCEQLNSCVQRLKSGSLLELAQTDPPKSFSASIGDHISSIFEESSKADDGMDYGAQADDPSGNSDLMTDFVMDDLFNDDANNVFDEKDMDRGIGFASTESPGPENTASKIKAAYDNLYFRSSKLGRITELMLSNRGDQKIVGIAKERLLLELQHWKQVS